MVIELIFFLTNTLFLPSISVKDGTFRKYEGPRSLQGFIDFISEQKWRETEPVPWWKSPNSFLYVRCTIYSQTFTLPLPIGELFP